MSDTAQLESQGPTAPEPPVAVGVEDRLMPGIVYALYLIGLVNGVTIVIGLILAYVCRDNAGPKNASHYEFLIRTFWISLAASVAGFILIFAFGLGLLILAAVTIWFIVRCAIGISRLLQNEPYPTPQSWLV